MLTPWLLLMSAIGIEVAATASLPRTEGFRDPVWTVVVLGAYGLSIWLLTVVIRDLPVAMTYAVWSGLGTAGIALVGALFLGERLDLVGALALTAIVGGVVVLNLNGAH